jgi:hypothetical protein
VEAFRLLPCIFNLLRNPSTQTYALSRSVQRGLPVQLGAGAQKNLAIERPRGLLCGLSAKLKVATDAVAEGVLELFGCRAFRVDHVSEPSYRSGEGAVFRVEVNQPRRIAFVFHHGLTSAFVSRGAYSPAASARSFAASSARPILSSSAACSFRIAANTGP